MIRLAALAAQARERMRYLPCASPWARGAVGLAAAGAGVGLVSRVASLGIDRGGALTAVGMLAVAAVALAVTVLPRAATAAALLLLLLPMPALASARARDAAAELAILAVLSTELTAWAADLRRRVPETPASLGRRGVEIAAAVVGAAAVGSLALAASELDGPEGRAALLLGLAAAGAAVGLLAWRARPLRTVRSGDGQERARR